MLRDKIEKKTHKIKKGWKKQLKEWGSKLNKK
jgi:hypothetical protein